MNRTSNVALTGLTVTRHCVSSAPPLVSNRALNVPMCSIVQLKYFNDRFTTTAIITTALRDGGFTTWLGLLCYEKLGVSSIEGKKNVVGFLKQLVIEVPRNSAFSLRDLVLDSALKLDVLTFLFYLG